MLITKVQQMTTALWSTEMQDDRFAIIMKAVCGLVMSNLRASLRITCSTVRTALHVRPHFSSKMRYQVRTTLVSSCISQSGQELKLGSMPRQHRSAEGAGSNATVACITKPITNSTLKMETACSFETSVSDHKITRRHISESRNLNNHSREHLKTSILLFYILRQLLLFCFLCSVTRIKHMFYKYLWENYPKNPRRLVQKRRLCAVFKIVHFVRPS
jgi:hypothetical protein